MADDSLESLFAAVEDFFTAGLSQNYDDKARAVCELRQRAPRDETAQGALRQLLYADDGCVRILSAEALSRIRAYANEAIPVLTTVLEVTHKHGFPGEHFQWVGLALHALDNYGAEAIGCEEAVWPFLFAQKNPTLCNIAAKVVINLAPVSSACWVIACLLCRHEDQALREYAQAEFRKVIGDVNISFDSQASLAGWRRPLPAPDQRTLFPELREEALERLKVSIDETSTWYARGWLSFDAGTIREIDAPELCEITFIAMLTRSFLTEDQIDVLLAQLSKPYRYDHRVIAYHFLYGWVEPQEPDEVPFEEQLYGWIEQQVFEENVTALWEFIEKAQTAIKRMQQADGVE